MRKAATHTLIPADDVEQLTGFKLDELERFSDSQHFVRIDPDGARREFCRVPLHLLSEPRTIRPLRGQAWRSGKAARTELAPGA
jgi:hypothetical protein